MKFRAIIFDMDGTIIDTEHVWRHANKELVTRKGHSFTSELEQEFRQQLTGLGLPESCRIIKELLGLMDDLEELIIEKAAIANEHYEENIKLIEGFVDFHEGLDDHNLKTGLATNAHTSTLEIVKRRFNLEQFFGHHMYNIAHVNNVCKPEPDLYLHAAEQLEVNPQECVAIEDSAHGVRAAKRAGMTCIGINTAKNPQQLEEADTIIDEYHEIDLHTLPIK